MDNATIATLLNDLNRKVDMLYKNSAAIHSNMLGVEIVTGEIKSGQIRSGSISFSDNIKQLLHTCNNTADKAQEKLNRILEEVQQPIANAAIDCSKTYEGKLQL